MLQKAQGTFVPAEQFNALVDEVNRLSSILGTLGPGLELVGGRGLALNLNRLRFGDPDCPRKVLAAVMGTQHTDTWAVETDGRVDGKGFELQIPIDVYFDTTTHLFTVRMRTLKADKYGLAVAVTGEGNAMTVFTTQGGCTT